MIAFVLSGECSALAEGEIDALYASIGKCPKKIAKNDNLLLIENNVPKETVSQISFSHEAFLDCKLASPNTISEVLLDIGIKKSDTFCVRTKGFPNNSKKERELGEIIYESVHAGVSLNDPKIPVYCISFGDTIVVSTNRIGSSDFSSRDPNARPFFHPLSLSPKLARLFLNLAAIPKGGCVLDPFCGSGSILIEAKEIGFKAIGRDLDKKMLYGSNKNLSYYGLSAKLEEGDATEIPDRELDAIVSDPPYARASKMFNRELLDLYSKFIASAYNALKSGGRLVMALPHDARIAYASVGFKAIGEYDIYVHKSLTRRVYVLEKP